MDTLTIREKLYEYIREADDETVEELYANIKNEVSEPYEWYNDPELVAELERRSADLKSGKDKGFTGEESRQQIIADLKNNG